MGLLSTSSVTRDARQLSRGGQRHKIAALVEAAAFDDPVKHFRPEPWNGLCNVRRF